MTQMATPPARNDDPFHPEMFFERVRRDMRRHESAQKLFADKCLRGKYVLRHKSKRKRNHGFNSRRLPPGFGRSLFLGPSAYLARRLNHFDRASE